MRDFSPAPHCWMRGPGTAPQYYRFPEGHMPAEMSYLRIEPAAVVLSALKKAEESDDIILRVFNASGEWQRATVDFFKPAGEVEAVNLHEKPIEGGNEIINLRSFQFEMSPDRKGTRINFNLEPYRIATIKMKVDLPAPINRWHNIEY